MMTIKDITAILESAVCLILLLVVFLKLVSDLRLDGFRQDMFAVRDELFDYAASGNIAFSDPAYRLLRQLMNGFIRYGHNLTFFRVSLSIAWQKHWESSPTLTWTTKWESALQAKDEKTKMDLVTFHNRAVGLVVQRLVLGSPVLLIALLCAALFIMMHRGWENLKQLFSDAASETVAQVLDTRLVEEEAARAAA